MGSGKQEMGMETLAVCPLKCLIVSTIIANPSSNPPPHFRLKKIGGITGGILMSSEQILCMSITATHHITELKKLTSCVSSRLVVCLFLCDDTLHLILCLCLAGDTITSCAIKS